MVYLLKQTNKNLFIYWLYLVTDAACGLELWRAGATPHCSVQASHCGGFS